LSTSTTPKLLFVVVRAGCQTREGLPWVSLPRDDGLTWIHRHHHPHSKKVFPVTQLCQDCCHYCIFVGTPAGFRADRSSRL
jgi:hypothetical protein